MSPLPLPLGRRGPSARGAGGFAGCAPARARAGSRSLWPPARAPSFLKRLSQLPLCPPSSKSMREKEGLERLDPCQGATRKSGGGLCVPPLHGTQLLPNPVPSFLFLSPPSSPASLGALSLHIVRFMASPLPSSRPVLQPGGGGNFLTFFFFYNLL